MRRLWRSVCPQGMLELTTAEARISERERERPDSRRSDADGAREGDRRALGLERPSSRFDREPRPSSSASRRERERGSERDGRRSAEAPREKEREREIQRERERRDGRSRDDRGGERHTRHVDVEVVVREVDALPSPAPPRRLLDGAPLDIQEAWICEDLMFILQGVEGSLIRYAEGYDPLDAEQRLKGARWRVDPSLGRC